MKETSVPTTKPPAGFLRWLSPYGRGPEEPYPDEFDIVEVWNDVTLRRYVLQPRMMHPGQNVAPLWWRPVKGFWEVEN